MKEDRQAVRKGKLYCSPRCGGGCTWAAYQTAVKAADALAKLLGPRWEGNVWENLGWHCSAINGKAEMYARPHPYKGETHYWLSIMGPKQITAEGYDPVVVVQEALELVEKTISEFEEIKEALLEE